MKLETIDKVSEGAFLTLYHIHYRTENGQKKVYEMVSRKKDLQTAQDLHGADADAVVIIATNESGDRLLLLKEYRMAVGGWVYNFPAGLIDDGETATLSAVRELREETGLELYDIREVLPPSYSAVGFSNERNTVVIGKAKGNFCHSTSAFEEIQAGWYSPEELQELQKSEMFTARAQIFCRLWSGTAKTSFSV